MDEGAAAATAAAAAIGAESAEATGASATCGAPPEAADQAEAEEEAAEEDSEAEEEAAEWIKENMTKPVAGFIGGATAPPGKRMGHAGAIISGGEGTAEEKKRVMTESGIKVAESPAKMGEAMIELLKEKGIAEKCKTH